MIFNSDGSCTVRDNGRGFPTAIVEDQGISGAELIMAHLYAGGRFWQRSSDSLPGIGVCVVNALSEWLQLRIWQQGKEYSLRFSEGKPQPSLRLVGDAEQQRGTEISFLPSSKFFPDTVFDATAIEQRLAELALLARKISVVFSDRR